MHGNFSIPTSDFAKPVLPTKSQRGSVLKNPNFAHKPQVSSDNTGTRKKMIITSPAIPIVRSMSGNTFGIVYIQSMTLFSVIDRGQ